MQKPRIESLNMIQNAFKNNFINFNGEILKIVENIENCSNNISKVSRSMPDSLIYAFTL